MYAHNTFLFICLSINGHLVCFHILGIMDTIAISMGMLVSLWYLVINSFGCILRHEIVGLYSKSIFNSLRSLCTVFHSGCSLVHSHQQCMDITVSSHPHPHLLSLFFVVDFGFCLFVFYLFVHFNNSHPDRWYLIVVFVCISLMFSDIENFFSYTCWPFVYLFWRNVYFNPYYIFKFGSLSFMGIFVCLLWGIRVLDILKIYPLMIAFSNKQKNIYQWWLFL